MIKISAPEIEQAAARALVICFFVNKRSTITSEPSLSNILAVLIGLKVCCQIASQSTKINYNLNFPITLYHSLTLLIPLDLVIELALLKFDL